MQRYSTMIAIATAAAIGISGCSKDETTTPSNPTVELKNHSQLCHNLQNHFE